MAKGCALSTGDLPRGGLPGNSMDRITDRPDLTMAHLDLTMAHLEKIKKFSS